MNSFNKKVLELFIFYAKKMFQTNAIFDVIFANPDLNTEKYGLKSLKFLYFFQGVWRNRAWKMI